MLLLTSAERVKRLKKIRKELLKEKTTNLTETTRLLANPAVVKILKKKKMITNGEGGVWFWDDRGEELNEEFADDLWLKANNLKAKEKIKREKIKEKPLEIIKFPSSKEESDDLEGNYVNTIDRSSIEAFTKIFTELTSVMLECKGDLHNIKSFAFDVKQDLNEIKRRVNLG